tara:strand:+ start:130 stop:420 length:291 start_codon:yes stop_codon:yes gene_type:complete
MPTTYRIQKTSDNHFELSRQENGEYEVIPYWTQKPHLVAGKLREDFLFTDGDSVVLQYAESTDGEDNTLKPTVHDAKLIEKRLIRECIPFTPEWNS